MGDEVIFNETLSNRTDAADGRARLCAARSILPNMTSQNLLASLLDAERQARPLRAAPLHQDDGLDRRIPLRTPVRDRSRRRNLEGDQKHHVRCCGSGRGCPHSRRILVRGQAGILVKSSVGPEASHGAVQG
jgi:hypothetical protein